MVSIRSKMGYRKRKPPVEKMKFILLFLFSGLVLTGITGHFFSRHSEEETTTSPIEERHKTFIKLLKRSENAIRWIGNKTADSLNEFFKNYSSAEVASASPLVKKKTQVLSWLRSRIGQRPRSQGPGDGNSREATSSQEPGDSGESLVIAHRTPDNTFSWGPPKKKHAITLPPEVYTTDKSMVEVAKKGVQNFFLYLYNASRSLTSKGTSLFKHVISRVYPQNTISLKKLYGFESAEDLENTSEKGKTAEGEKKPCNSVLKPICAVDPEMHFTIFPNLCKMRQFNLKHGTNFSEFHSKVCMDLFATHSDLFFQNN